MNWLRSTSAPRPGAPVTGASGGHILAHRPLLESPSDLLIAALVAVAVAVTGGVWVWGQLAGLLFARTWPPTSPAEGLGIAFDLPGHIGDPRRAWPAPAREVLPGPVGMGFAAVLTLALVVGAGVLVGRWLGGRRQVRGWACAAQIRASLSGPAALARVRLLRPGLADVTPVAAEANGVRRWRRARAGVPRDPLQVAVDLGQAQGQRVMAAIDEGVVMMAPPRAGKTSQVIIPWLTDWPGPAVVTSVRTDVALETLALRRERGSVAVLDLSGARWPQALAWSPTSGCERFDKARRRADTMVTVGRPETGGSDSTNAGFFAMTSINLLAGWLHCAAVTGRSMNDVLGWAMDERQDEPIRLLRDHPRAAPGVAALLDGIYRSPAETRSNMWTTVGTAVAPLLADNARAVFAPPPGDSFDIERFLTGGRAGTVYLIVPEHEARQVAPLITAFVDEITRTATRLAGLAPTGRLDPPLGLFLDEVANVVPLPELPHLMSYAAGSGIFVAAILQDLAQARARWGRDGADMIWAAATCKIALGGLSGDELGEFSRLAGKYRESLTSAQFGGQQGTVYQTSLNDRDVIAPDLVRQLSRDERQALIIHAGTPAVLTRMRRHFEGPHAAEHAASKAQTRAALLAAESGGQA